MIAPATSFAALSYGTLCRGTQSAPSPLAASSQEAAAGESFNAEAIRHGNFDRNLIDKITSDIELAASVAFPSAHRGQSSFKTTSARPNEPKQSSYATEKLAAGELFVSAEGNQSLSYRAAKRTLDFLGALALLVVFAPLMLVVFLTLCITTGGQPLFIQERIGHRGRRFTLAKFRTMRHNAATLQLQVKNEKDGPIFKNRRDPRITWLGRYLRSTSIDELPQLFNVLLGSMSLVGPRPPLAKEVALYQPWQRRRLAVKPGLTCLWQISGRSEIGFEDWVRMDIWYLANQSLATDLSLLVRTPLSVISGRGAY